jgi:hypothetical protein
MGINNSHFRERVSYDQREGKLEDTNSGLGSNFENTEEWEKLVELSKIKESMLCPTCFFWFNRTTSNVHKDEFKNIHPFHILWYNYFDDDAHYFMNFGDKNKEDILEMIDYYKKN